MVFRVWSATKLAIESINGRSGRIGVSSNEDHVPQIRRAMQLRSSSEWRACLGQVLISRQERAMVPNGSTCSLVIASAISPCEMPASSYWATLCLAVQSPVSPVRCCCMSTLYRRTEPEAFFMDVYFKPIQSHPVASRRKAQAEDVHAAYSNRRSICRWTSQVCCQHWHRCTYSLSSVLIYLTALPRA